MNGRQFAAALKHGYRSGLEIKVKDYLVERNVRVKYEAIKIEWEDLMYRTYTPDFVLESSRRKLSKGAKTTYGQWCEKNKILFYDRIIPEDWLNEKGKDMHPDLIHFPFKKVKRK